MKWHLRILPPLLFSAACTPIIRPPTLPPAPPPVSAPPAPQFEKTFGSITINPAGALIIRYKTITLTAELDLDGAPRIKGAQPGKKSMLKQGDAFVFVSAVKKSYLLEFDNGRNIFLCGEAEAPEGLREFVYDLRDDGREIYAGLFYRRSNQDETMLGQLIGLLQPDNALILRSSTAGLPSLNLPALHKALRDEFYENPLAIVTDAREIPF